MSAQDIINAMYASGKTLVLGHRGAKAYAPMNTIPAFELASEQGAHGVELDVQLSSDGELVIVHDFTVDGTTDGSGNVADMSLAELKTLDAGAWFDPKFIGTKIPTLDEVFDAVGHFIINVELKTIDQQTKGLEQKVADCIANHNMIERVIVSSFNPYALKHFRAIAPDIAIGFLQAPDFTTDAMRAVMNDVPYEADHWHYTMLGDDLTQRPVNVWTLNDPDIAREQAKKGVKGIITDTPDVILKALASE